MPDFGPIPESTSSAGKTMGVGAAIGADVGKVKEQSTALLDAAKGNGFRVSEDAAKPIQEALAEAQSDLFTIMQEAQYLGQQPMLGTGPYAEQVARHVQQSNSGAQGLLPVLDQLLETLRQSDEALRTAMENYRRAEDDQKSTFNT